MDKRPNTCFQHQQTEVTGILLANLGTPDEPTAPALRRYLAEFLSDRRIIEAPRWLWWFILNGIILRTRPKEVAKGYASVWSDEGSPLLVMTRRQGALLAQRLEQSCPGPVKVACGMRYGNPSIASAARELREAGARRVLLLPMYPQYAAATTASTFDALALELMDWRHLPELRMVNHYHDHPQYINALVASIREHWKTHPPAEKLLFSFHGVPRSTLLAGDPYHCECQKTARLVAEALELPDDRWQVSFQSRFGRAEWLQPYTIELLGQWGQAKLASVDVICPGFSADCLETIEEIEEENRERFQESGGGEFRYIPALNDRDDHIALIEALVHAHCKGWPEVDAEFSCADAETLSHRRDRALALGAAR